MDPVNRVRRSRHTQTTLVIRTLAVMIATLAGIAAPLACGGRSQGNHPQGAAGETSNAGFGGTSASGGGGNVGGASECISANYVGCARYADCCSGMCSFDIGAIWDDAGHFLPESTGTCRECKKNGEACGGSQAGGCCSGFCDHKGRCSCAGADRLCTADSDCCSGFCYRLRSRCLDPECDPRLVSEADPETCWLDLQ